MERGDREATTERRNFSISLFFIVMNFRFLHSIWFHFTLGLCLVVLGLGLFYLRDSNAFAHAEPAAPPVAATTWTAPKPDTISGNPTSIAIPSLDISLPVINGTYNKTSQTWTLTNDKVQYATITPPPNNASGNTFLYGHYRKGVFATLHLIKPGAQAFIMTDNGHTFTYTFTSSRETNPADDSVFTYTGAPILTIQTCSGLFFQNRQFFTFTLTRVA
jgi:LPXTG-site transpeptidase (sortase) family protein